MSGLYTYLVSVTVMLTLGGTYRGEQGQIVHDLGSCTAVAISKTTLLTAAHCVDHVDKVYIDHYKSKNISVVKMDMLADLALIQVKGANFKPVVLGIEPHVTDRVYTVNAGDGNEKTWGEGIVNNLVVNDPAEHHLMILDSIKIAPGASGSGLFDSKGQLVGINTIAAEVGSLAVDTITIKKFLNQ